MRIVNLTPGAGDMYCGNCLRDNAAVASLRKQGHEVLMVPLYLPLTVDEENQSAGTPVFFGGINVYLQQKSSLFRKLPNWTDKALNSSWLLKKIGNTAGSADNELVAELTLSMVRGEDGLQRKELERLIEWLLQEPPADVVVLSSALLMGVARRIAEVLKVPIVCMVSGEDKFIDLLDEPLRSQIWSEMQNRVRDVDAFIGVSHYYMQTFGERLCIPETKRNVVHNGINLDGFPLVDERTTRPPVLGYFARLSADKGLGILLEAYRLLKSDAQHKELMLAVAGSLRNADRSYLEQQKEFLAQNKLLSSVEILPNVTREEKIAFYSRIELLCVPSLFDEAFGFHVVEAWAAGVPVVKPERGAFPELLALSHAGVAYWPNEPGKLAQVLDRLLQNRPALKTMGELGRTVARKYFDIQRMTRDLEKVFLKCCGAKTS